MRQTAARLLGCALILAATLGLDSCDALSMTNLMFLSASATLDLGVTFRGAVAAVGSTHLSFNASDGAGDYTITLDKERSGVDVTMWGTGDSGKHRFDASRTTYTWTCDTANEDHDIEVWSGDNTMQTFEITVAKVP